jgi:hypothetical protein
MVQRRQGVGFLGRDFEHLKHCALWVTFRCYLRSLKAVTVVTATSCCGPRHKANRRGVTPALPLSRDFPVEGAIEGCCLALTQVNKRFDK